MWVKYLKDRVVRISLLILLSVLSPFIAHANVTQAVDYLATQQSTDGSFHNTDTQSTPFQATSETVRSLDFVAASGQVDIVAAQDLLNTTDVRNTEYLSRLLVNTDSSSPNQQLIIDQLLQHQNDDGGFGDYPGYDSTVLDTSQALEALSEVGQQISAIQPAVVFLLTAQSVNGSWSDGSNADSIYVTALTMRALWHYKTVFSDVAVAVSNAKDFLLATRLNTTGLWPNLFESALSLIALVPNATEFSQVESILTELRNQQSTNGSWDDDVYTTALALRALASQPTPLPTPVTTGSISGSVINNVTGQPIANTDVSLNGTAISTTTDIAGAFLFDGLDASSYSINLNAAGYSQLSLSNITVQAGVVNALGNISLTSLPTTGVMTGQLLDSATGIPVAGVTVSVTGSTIVSTTSLNDGSFSLTGLNPGGINITIVKAGYSPLTASATIVAGNTLVLNQNLVASSLNSIPQSGTQPTGSIRGVVTDSSTGLPIEFVAVTVKDANTNAALAYRQTASDGSYDISGLSPGDIVIAVNKTGFLSAEASGSLMAGNVLVFNPGLVPVGSDPATGTGGNVTQEPLANTPTEASVQGVITDLETSLPLAGVNVSITGINSVTTTTAVDGSYSFTGLTPGDITITASLQNYLDVTADGNAAAGNTIVFSPQMSPVNYVGNENGQIIGQVVDTITQDALRFVTVRAVNNINEVTVSTLLDGSFQLDNVPPGEYLISFERTGYVTRSYSALVTSGGVTDLQTIELDLAINKVTLFGQLVDQLTNEPIDGANVSIVGTATSTLTDANGQYLVEDLDPGTMTLTFSATGYNSQTIISSFTQGGQYEVNRSLSPASGTGLDLNFLMTNQTVYEAYTTASIEAVVANTGSPIEAMIRFTLLDEQDKVVAEFNGTRQGSDNPQIQFAIDEIVSLSAEFNTANLVPGNYRIIGRVEVGNQMVGPATAILDERLTDFSIAETRRVGSIKLVSLPAFSAVGVNETLNVHLTLSNHSNVDLPGFTIGYRLLDPDGLEIRNSNSISLPLDAEETTYSLVLETFDHQFTKSGSYSLTVYSSPSIEVVDTELGSIEVAPGLHIEINQSVTPMTVTPDEDQRVRINIRLEGRELQ